MYYHQGAAEFLVSQNVARSRKYIDSVFFHVEKQDRKRWLFKFCGCFPVLRVEFIFIWKNSFCYGNLSSRHKKLTENALIWKVVELKLVPSAKTCFVRTFEEFWIEWRFFSGGAAISGIIIYISCYLWSFLFISEASVARRMRYITSFSVKHGSFAL